MKLNNEKNYENIIVEINPKTHPITWENRVKSLLTGGMSRKEAEEKANEPIEVEMYYDQNAGLFLIEAEAVENESTIYNPYSGKEMEQEEILT